MSVTERLHASGLGHRGRQWRAGLTHTLFGSKTRKAVFFTAALFIVLIVLIVFAAFFIDEPLRQRMEANLNRSLTGYTVRIGKLDFHPIGLSLELEDSVISQNDNPEPPVAEIANLTAGIQWRALHAAGWWLILQSTSQNFTSIANRRKKSSTMKYR